MQIGGVEVAERSNHIHHVNLDDLPTPLEESPGEAVGAGSLVTRHTMYSTLDLLLRDWSSQDLKVRAAKV